MKITESQLRTIIRQEISRAIISEDKMELKGDVAAAAKAAASALGLDPSQVGKLGAIMSAVKGKENMQDAFESLKSDQKNSLAMFALSFILKNKEGKGAAAKKLASAGGV